MRALAMVALVACGGGATRSAEVPVPPATAAERMLAMLPPGAQVVVELDLARLRANPVVGGAVARALASGELPAGVPASPLAEADQVVLAAYGVGTAQAATLTVLAAPHDLAGASKLTDGYYIVGPPDWVEQAQARVALSTTGDAKLAITAAPELLALRKRAMPAGAPGAALRVTARLPFDARVALARQTGLDAAPAQLSAWADVADDLALIVDCDAADPGAKRANEAARRLAASLRGTLAALADEPLARALGLPASLTNARLVAQGAWVRTIVAVGPAHLKRVVERANALLALAPGAKPAPADTAKPDAAKPDAAKPDAAKPDAAKPAAAPPDAAKPDAAKSGAAKPDAVKPDAAKPDAAKPGATKFDAAMSGAAKPDAVKPGAAKFDAAKPGAAKFDAAKFDAAKPDAAKPDAAKLDAATAPRGDRP